MLICTEPPLDLYAEFSWWPRTEILWGRRFVLAKLQKNVDEATTLLQRARAAEDAWLEVNAQIKDFLCQKRNSFI